MNEYSKYPKFGDFPNAAVGDAAGHPLEFVAASDSLPAADGTYPAERPAMLPTPGEEGLEYQNEYKDDSREAGIGCWPFSGGDPEGFSGVGQDSAAIGIQGMF